MRLVCVRVCVRVWVGDLMPVASRSKTGRGWIWFRGERMKPSWQGQKANEGLTLLNFVYYINWKG